MLYICKLYIFYCLCASLVLNICLWFLSPLFFLLGYFTRATFLFILCWIVKSLWQCACYFPINYNCIGARDKETYGETARGTVWRSLAEAQEQPTLYTRLGFDEVNLCVQQNWPQLHKQLNACHQQSAISYHQQRCRGPMWSGLTFLW